MQNLHQTTLETSCRIVRLESCDSKVSSSIDGLRFGWRFWIDFCNSTLLRFVSFFASRCGISGGDQRRKIHFSESGDSLNGPDPFTEIFSFRIPYKRLHSLNALPHSVKRHFSSLLRSLPASSHRVAQPLPQTPFQCFAVLSLTTHTPVVKGVLKPHPLIMGVGLKKPINQGVSDSPPPLIKGVGLNKHYKTRGFWQSTPSIKGVNLHPLT